MGIFKLRSTVEIDARYSNLLAGSTGTGRLETRHIVVLHAAETWLGTYGSSKLGVFANKPRWGSALDTPLWDSAADHPGLG